MWTVRRVCRAETLIVEVAESETTHVKLPRPIQQVIGTTTSLTSSSMSSHTPVDIMEPTSTPDLGEMLKCCSDQTLRFQLVDSNFTPETWIGS
jgi:hypothetical protein